MQIRIKKGLDIRLTGEAAKELKSLPMPETAVIRPPDFTGVVPRLLVHEGDEVKAGTPLFIDKANERIRFCAPVSGEVVEINRGDKRRILEIKILADREISHLSFEAADSAETDPETIIEKLLQSGVWPVIRQRPYGIIAKPSVKPVNIFISAFDSAPLAPDFNFILHDQGEDFNAGLQVLAKLTDGSVHLCLRGGVENSPVFTNAQGVKLHTITGPHPAGNPGVQIHHIAPVNKGEVTWCVQPQDVAVIGRLFRKGIYDATRVIAITGSEVISPRYYKTVTGAAIKHMLEDTGLRDGENRIICGNVLTGRMTGIDGHTGFYDNQVTVIPEGNEPEFIGWMKPGFDKFSNSRAYFSWLTPQKKYALDTNMHGEERPFVVSGQYEEVFPMDIYPVQLLKSIMVEDIDMMERLGIYEVVEEDFALCEFVCTSKIECQQIIRKGLDIVRKELG